MNSAGSCPCHPNISDAIAAHRSVVDTQARLLLHPADAGYDDLISDGMLALWKALATYDPERGDLEPWLAHRIRYRMIDGLRAREGRGPSHRPAPAALDDEHHIPLAAPAVEEDDIASALDAHTTATALLRAAATIDPRLPHVLQLIANGYTRHEAGAQIGVSRTRVYQLLSQLTNPARTSRRRT